MAEVPATIIRPSRAALEEYNADSSAMANRPTPLQSSATSGGCFPVLLARGTGLSQILE